MSPSSTDFLINDPAVPDAAACAFLETELKIPRPLARILVSRGLDDRAKVQQFFRHDLKNLGDPLLFKDLEKACRRLEEALKTREPIVIWGDYDVDGITATALLYNCLTALDARVRYHIPSRMGEGYGLSIDGIQTVAGWGTTLLVAVDTGITAGREVEECRRLGLEVIIIDHHLPVEGHTPAAYATVNPRQADCPYPDKNLAAVGLAYKLASALYNICGRPVEEVDQYLDLVALGTAADVVPLLGENRTLTYFGLRQLVQTRNRGLQSLMAAAQMNPAEVSSRSLSFSLAPVLNAAGRLGEAERGVRLLIDGHDQEKSGQARELVEENRRRQELDAAITETCIRQVREEINLEETFFITLGQRGWHPGVLGIVASRLVDAFHRPSLVISIDGAGEARGSLRGVEGYHLVEALSACSGLLLKFGGHQFAAGLTVRETDMPALFRRLNEHARQRLSLDQFRRRLKPEAEIGFADIDARFISILKMFEPFGQHNPRPLFLSRGCLGANSPRVVGRKHLRFNTLHNDVTFPCIAFGQAGREEELSTPGRLFDLFYTIEDNTWQGVTQTQLNVRAIRMEG
jgi:single-stranded-DNA-specific exonuclease